MLFVILGIPRASAAPAIVPPAGWRTPALPQAQDRAAALAAQMGGEVLEVASTAEVDDFVETLALVEVPEPLPRETMTEDAAARAYVDDRAGRLLDGATITRIERVPTGEAGLSYIDARLQADPTYAHVAIVPYGARTLWVVAWSSGNEAPLYRRVAEPTIRAVAALATPPITPFDRGGALLTAWLGWLLAGGVVYVALLLLADRRGDHFEAATKSAWIVGGATLVVGAGAAIAFGSSAERLALVGTTPLSMAVHVALPGALLAIAALVASRLLSSSGRIASAPEGAGTGLPQLYRPYDNPPGPPSTEGPGASGEPPVTGSPPAAIDLPPAEEGDPPATLTDAHEVATEHPIAAIPKMIVEDRTPVPSDSVAGAYHLDLAKEKAKTGDERRTVGAPQRPITETHTPVPKDAEAQGSYTFARRGGKRRRKPPAPPTKKGT
ncbi:MAG: hypothetical protein D6705_07715 [Deltaproteobacteria bacterium]|nr:MAG: hypothetical protein D6705_07715 [Deltaproteobacteria bacterium]